MSLRGNSEAQRDDHPLSDPARGSRRDRTRLRGLPCFYKVKIQNEKIKSTTQKSKLTLDRKKTSFWVGGLILLYAVSFSFLCFRKFTAFEYHDFDLAVYAQVLWNLLHGSLYSSILGIPILGNHFVPILFLIAPLYAIFPSPLILLFLQTLLLGGGAWFVYRLGLRLLDADFALVLAFVYLLYPALLFLNLFEFHPVAFATFFLLGALEAFERQTLSRFLIFILLALACQEDVSLVVAAVGVYGWLRGRSLFWILMPLGLGVSWFCLSVLFLMPRWNPGTIHFSLLYSHLGRNPLEVFGSILLHPLKTLSLMLEGSDRRLFIVNLLAPLGFLPLLDPKSFFLALPGFFEQLLSRRRSQHLLGYHYTALLIPFLFFAALQGLRKLLGIPQIASKRRLLQGLLIGLSAISAVAFGPLGSVGELLNETRWNVMDQKRRQLVQVISPNASVVATFEFLPHLAHRRYLYSLHHFFTGRHTLSEKPYVFPKQIDFLLIDFNDPLTLFFLDDTPDSDLRLAHFLKGWKVREVLGDLVLFEKGEGAFFIKQVNDISSARNMYVRIDKTITLLGLNGLLEKGREGSAVPLTFSWECLRPPTKQYGLLFKFLDSRKRLIAQQYHSIGYRVLPTPRWKEGERFEEIYSLVLPRPARGETSYELRISCVDERAAQLVPIASEGEMGNDMSFGMIEVAGG